MNYTSKQINTVINGLVSHYLKLGYTEDHSFTLNDKPNTCVYSSLVKDSCLARIKTCYRREHLVGDSYPITCLDIIVEEFEHGRKVRERLVNHLYMVANKYFTSDKSVFDSCRSVGLRRYIASHCGKTGSIHVNFRKFTDSLKSYTIDKIDKIMDESHRSHNYTVTDTYFTGLGVARDFVVVIKHDDCNATEAMYLNV